MLGASELNVSASGVAEGGLHVVLAPSHCGLSSVGCLKGGQLQLGRQDPVL